MKKRFTFLFLLCFLAFGAFAQQEEAAPKADPDPLMEETGLEAAGAEITFEQTTIDYGTVDQGSDPYRTFKFTNTGDAPLKISNAKGSCGCTVPTWSREDVAPGESGVIKVRYDTKRLNAFTKTVTVTTNAMNHTEGMSPGMFRLTIKGNVKAVPVADPATDPAAKPADGSEAPSDAGGNTTENK